MFDGWTGPDVTTFWIAAGALAVALTSFVWQLYYATRIDRPKLRVRIDERKIQRGHNLDPVVRMTVTNVGRRATVVTNLLLNIGPRPFWHGRFERLAKHEDLLAPRVDEFMPQLNSRLPARMDPGDAATIYVPRHEVIDILYRNGHGEGRKIHAAAHATTADTRRSRTLALPPPKDDAPAG